MTSSHTQGVYLCRDKALRVVKDQDAFTVVKILSRKSCIRDEETKLFCREMELAQTIKHDNVLSAKEFFRDDDFIAYNMEYIEGGTLADVLTLKSELPIASAVDLIMQVCTGIEAIHNFGVVHRDVKPENILINKNGQAKIADFGIAANLNDSADSLRDDLTGSINYLSPEYVESGTYDKRTDIYAIGVVFYEILTGQLPFKGKNLLETLTMRVLHDPIVPTLLREDLPNSLSSVVLKSMRRDPNSRYQSTRELYQALFQALPNLRIQYSREILQNIVSKALFTGSQPVLQY